MKKRLLMLFAVLIGGTAIGTVSAQTGTKTVTYYTVGTVSSEGEGDGTSSETPHKYSTLDGVLTAVESASNDSTVISLPAGTYSNDAGKYSIKKSGVLLQGVDTNTVVMSSRLQILIEDGNVTVKGIHFSGSPVAGSSLLTVNRKGVNLTLDACKFTLNTQNATSSQNVYAIIGAASANATSSPTNNNVLTLRNTHISLPYAYQRGIYFYSGTGHTLTLDNSQIEGPNGASGHEYVQGISFQVTGAGTEPINCNISGSTIDVNYYGCYIFSNASNTAPININVDNNSNLTAWGTIYAEGKSANAAINVNVQSSNLTGRSFFTGNSDGFATVVVKSCPNFNMTVDAASTLTAKYMVSDPKAFMSLFYLDNTAGKFTFTNGAVAGQKCALTMLNPDYADSPFVEVGSTTFSVEGIENTYISDGTRSYALVYNEKGEFSDALYKLSDAITETPANGKIALPAGTYKLPAQLVIDKQLTLQGSINGADTTVIEPASTLTAEASLLSIAANATVQDLIVQGSHGDGIAATNAATAAILKNVISRDNAKNGLSLAGAKLAANGLRTYGNKADVGVLLTKVTDAPVFTPDKECRFAETVAIKSTDADATAGYVVSNDWYKTTKNNVSVWTSASTSGLNFAITSVPSSVIYGQANLPLLTNVDSSYIKAFPDKVKITVSDATIAKIKAKEGEAKTDSLEILKPGTVTLTLQVGDTTVTQDLKVTKKQLIVSGLYTTDKIYDGKDTTWVYTDTMKVQGLVGTDSNVFSITDNKVEGKLESATAGQNKVVGTTETPFALTFVNNGKNYADYYTAAIGTVTKTINKKEVTVGVTTGTTVTTTATTPKFTVNYGAELPVFAATYTGLVSESSDKTELDKLIKFDCPVTKTTMAGVYPVMPAGLSSPNYTFNYVADSVQVNAVAPTVEMLGITVNSLSQNDCSITAKARVLSNGGTKTTELKGAFTTAKANGNSPANTNEGGATIAVNADGTFEATLTGIDAAKTDVSATATATVGENTLTGTAATAINVDLSLKLQNIAFGNLPSNMVYGSSVPITVSGYAEDATIQYTFSSEGVLTLDGETNTLTAAKAGITTITVTATKDEYLTATAKHTITVAPKTLTVKATAAPVTYSGKTDATVTYELIGVIDADKETVKLAENSGVTASFADPNVGQGKAIILSKDLALDGNSNNNYTLTQPSGITGTINPAEITAIGAKDVTRKYNGTSLSYSLEMTGLVNNEKPTDAGLYSGTIEVKEDMNGGQLAGTYSVMVSNLKFKNYKLTDNVTLDSKQAITIEKGVPSIVGYNKSSEAGAEFMILDKAGWADNELSVEIKTDGDKSFAVLTYDTDKTVTSNSVLTNATAPSLNISLGDNGMTPKSAKAVFTRAGGEGVASTEINTTMSYGGEKVLTLTDADKYEYSSSSPSVLTIDNERKITTTGVGTASILIKAKENSAIAKYTIQVKPASLTLVATGTEKVYDGSTIANPVLALTGDVAIENVSVDLTDLNFNYATKDAGTSTILPSRTISLTGDKAVNYQLATVDLSGKIEARDLTIGGVSKQYDGTKTIALKEYSAQGLVDGEAAPVLTVTFDDANAGVNKKVSYSVAGANYKLTQDKAETGTIIKSTLEATLPETASGEASVRNKVSYIIRENGAEIVAGSAGAKEIGNYLKVTPNGTNAYFVDKIDNENCDIVLNGNQIGFKADPPSGGGVTTVSVNSVSLDKTELTLPRTESYTLVATINPSDASDKSVTWKSSDESVAKVDANGKVTALKVGTATITVTTVDGAKTATCEVTVDFATGLEEALANTQVYAKQGNIYVNPIQPLQLTIVNMLGKTVYNARISSYAQIPVANGIYIVKLTNAGNTIVTKVNVY